MKQNEILLDGYLNNNPQLSQGSIVSYERMTKKYDELDLAKAKFNEIMEIVKKEVNPNTKSATLNLAILLTKSRMELNNRLQKERESIKMEIDSRRKTLLLLQVVTLKKDIPTDQQNYIYYNRKEKNITLLISSYKTFKNYGQKTITITDEKFIKIFKQLNYKDGDYLLSLKKGERPSVSYLGDIIKSMTAFGLREGSFFKIVLKHLLEEHKYQELEAISLTRGTSLAVILTSYNLLNN
jgi:hypothetical protein